MSTFTVFICLFDVVENWKFWCAGNCFVPSALKSEYIHSSDEAPLLAVA